jgi:2-dehydropantoate 2-reductase
MNFCIVGAGAIGGFLGARLALAGEEVTFIARGENLAAIREHGVRIVDSDREHVARNVRALEGFDGAGRFDTVLLTLKANQLAGVAGKIESLCHEDTAVIPMQNGLPFWYFVNHGGPLAGRAVESVDPGGRIRDAIAARRIIGAVVYVAAQRLGPGTVRHMGNNRLPMGELDGRKSDRIARIAKAFNGAGFEANVIEDIRAETWLKLWGNVSFNPISALTHAALSDICTDVDGRDLAARMMRETQAVAEKLGIAFRLDIDRRIEGAKRVGRHKTSMLQDVEAGRPIEVDALVGSVVEMARLVGVDTPTVDAIYQATKLLDRTMRSQNLSVKALPSVAR